MAENFDSVVVNVAELLTLILEVPVDYVSKALLVDHATAHRQQIITVGVLVSDGGAIPLLNPLFILIVVLGSGLVTGEVDIVVVSHGSVPGHLVDGMTSIAPLEVLLFL